MTRSRRSLESRMSLLAEAGALLASTLDRERALTQLVRLAVPALGDLCAIDILGEDGTTSRVAYAHRDGTKEALVYEAPVGVRAAIRSGQPVLVSEAGETDLMAEAQSADQLRTLQQLKPRTWLVLPLTARDRVLGAITFAMTDSAGSYDRVDVRTAEVVARQVALTLDGTRLQRDTEAARSATEAANRAKDEFLMTLSHELRNPLNAVSGWAKLLEIGKLGEEQSRHAIEVILRNVNAQVRLVDDLLDMSSVVSGKMRLAIQPVNVADVIGEALDAVRPGAEAKGIQLQSVLDSPGAQVSGDPGRLQQVVWNLLYNAVKFTPKAGRILVKLQQVKSHVEIIVSDTGQGIRPDLLPYIFDRLRQGDSSRSRAHGGLGIGLALVRHIAELHGGSVFAESPGEEQGATFVVKLPLMVAGVRDHAVAQAKSGPPDSPSLVGVRVLVVDDDPAAVELVQEVLTQTGGEVRGAGTAEEALRVLEQWRPDVLVSDIEMPGQDGYTLIRKIRALAPERGGMTRAVALTAFGRPEDRIRSLMAGFNIHVSKPVDPGELAAIVASLAGRTG
jgi:signal transduction histidine kinase